MSGALTAPLLLFGASVSHTVYLIASSTQKIYMSCVQERVMWNSEVCFPLACGVPLPLSWAHLCGAWQLAQPLLSAQWRTSHSHIGKGRIWGWLATRISLSLLNSFILSVLFVHLYVLMFLKKSLLIFIILYHKNVFLQYLSCQFITKKCRDFYFYWKHYYSYVLLLNRIFICIECLLMLNSSEYITFSLRSHDRF